MNGGDLAAVGPPSREGKGCPTDPAPSDGAAGLAQSESRLRAVVLASADVSYRMSPDWSALWELYSHGNLMPHAAVRRTWVDDYVHPDDRAQVRDLVGEGLRTQRAFYIEHRVQHADGNWGWLRSHVVPLTDEAGETREWVAAGLDVTAVHLEAEQLLAANRRKSQFLATLAHELRNPLAALVLSVQTMQHQLEADGTLPPLWAVMTRQMEHLEDLVHGVLDVARLDEGLVALQPEPTTVAQLVSRTLDIAGPIADRAGVTLRIEVPAEPIWVDADPVRLTQVLVNVLDNACKFTPAGGWVEARVTAGDGSVTYTITDTGTGLAPDAQPHVFDLFWQGAPQAANHGLGVGLTLAAQIVALHQGTIRFGSVGAGEGSTVVITLPLGHAPDGPAAPPSAPSMPRHRVLVVDDNPDVREVLAAALDGLGVAVKTAGDGRGALALLDVWPPTVVFLDLGMAPLDGFDVARQIRQQPQHAHLPLVALTGWGSRDDVQRTAAAGFAHHLVKPVDLVTLQTTLASLPLPLS